MICTRLAMALFWAASLAHFEGNPAEVERFASDVIELSTRHNFAFWLAGGEILRGWARSASGDTAEGLPVDRRRNRELAGHRRDSGRAILSSPKG